MRSLDRRQGILSCCSKQDGLSDVKLAISSRLPARATAGTAATGTAATGTAATGTAATGTAATGTTTPGTTTPGA
ncbi:hypothetical protein, partial [Variovorax sp. JS1663]|uniref:hypothetical protein n=1 Tax=Variovorax sp. JS1663 TaxID=1851577 RepID=UPI001EE0A8DF